MTMTDKLTPKSMKGQYNHQYNVFCRKNHDYGNSFEKSLDTFGLVAGIVRMSDKFERLVSLNDPSKDAQIASESLVDTLEDLSNYAAMAACWLKGKKKADWNELRMKALDGNIEDIIKKVDTTVVKTKDNLHINSTGGTSSVDTKTGAIKFMPVRGTGKSKSIQQAVEEALVKGIEFADKPELHSINLFGPKELELNLKEEVDQDKLFEISNALRPSNLPKSVKVNYGHVGTFEFPDGIDAISYYVREMQKEEAKKENDRVMLDMMLSRIEKGEVVRIVANGDGSFTTYFEKTDGPFDKIVDKEDETIFHEREGWEEEEKKKTLNDIRKEHGFDPVNGEDNEG